MKTGVLIAAAALGLAGCFYVEPINQRPSLDIKAADDPIFRGDTVTYSAIVVDPDGHDVDVTWRVFTCTDTTTNDCDVDAAFSGTDPQFVFDVPYLRADGVAPVESLKIVLDGRDDHGATAKPIDQLTLPVLDRSPTLDLRKVSVYEQQPGPQYVIGMPIELYAKYTDGDDALDTLNVEWKVYTPTQIAVTLDDIAVTQDKPTERQVGKLMTPTVIGEWTVEVTITDPIGNTAMRSLTFNIVPDRAPCLSVVAPIVPPNGASLPVTEPTLFQVPSVSDDLDSYPRTSGGALFGAPTFVWSILVPGSPRTVISGATGSSTQFDPATLTPGTIVELRVEIQDRKLTPVNCQDSEATCSTGGNTCIQRQTWRVEAQ